MTPKEFARVKRKPDEIFYEFDKVSKEEEKASLGYKLKLKTKKQKLIKEMEESLKSRKG